MGHEPSLIGRVVAARAAPGDPLADPICGSGTTGLAAVCAGYRSLRIDREPAYVELTARRLRAAAG